MAKQLSELQQGVQQLVYRQKLLRSYFYLAVGFFVLSVLVLFNLKDLWFQLNGISLHLNYLHVPMAMAEAEQRLPLFIDEPFHWALAKLFLSIVVTWWVIRYIKQRFMQGLTFAIPKDLNTGKILLKNIGVWLKLTVIQIFVWLVCIVGVWMVLEKIQTKISPLPEYDTAEWIAYPKQIEQSRMYAEITDLNPPAPVAHYLMAQAALLHQPTDFAQAKQSLSQLAQVPSAQQLIAQNISPQVVWTMQQQVYGQAQGTSTAAVAQQAQTLQQQVAIARWVVLGLCVLLFWWVVATFTIGRNLANRIKRIQQGLLG